MKILYNLKQTCIIDLYYLVLLILLNKLRAVK